MTHSKTLKKNLKWIAIGTYLSNIISLIISIYIIRELSVDEFGIYSMFLSSITIFSVISNGGILVSTRRFIPELYQKKNYKYLKKIVFKLRLLATLISIVLLIIVYLFRRDFGVILNIPKFEILYKIFMVNIFLYLQKSLYNIDLVAFHKQKIMTIIQIFSLLVRGILYLLLITRITIELIFVVEAITLGMVMLPSFVFSLIFYHNLPNTNKFENSDDEKKKYNKRIIRYSLFSFSNEMGANILSEVSDYYLISAFLGPVSLGLYAFPNKVLKIVLRWIPVNRIVNMIRPIYLSKFYEEGKSNKALQEMFDFILKGIFILYSIVFGYVILYQGLIVRYVFSSKYDSNYELFIIVLLSYLFSFFIHPVNLVMEATEHIQYNLYSKFFAVFNIFTAIIVLMYTDFGIIGVALATGVSNFLKNYFIYYFMKEKTGICINKIELIKLSIISLMFLSFINIFYHLSSSLGIKLLVPSIGGVCLYWFSLARFGVFREKEKELIRKIVNIEKAKRIVRRLRGYFN